ncbi:uncharacterized protein LOC114360875 [Ostrinia furnacalis]|uniref:uncharacterized protein LOC114360875 n=1 Tax=Ostrinia furnacalis TaxID=93504 RepID=UPI00103F5041|nr:uncharacterized protein LOC114360875 [Ostrinia furnacalis]
MDTNLGTQVKIMNSIDNKLTSAPHSIQKSSLNQPRDAATQVLLTCNNIETDISFAPIFENQSAGIISGDIAFYKPCGMNTESLKLETTHVNKRSVMTSKSNIVDTPKTGSTASKPKKKVSVKISTPEQILNDIIKTDLATETVTPRLKRTEPNIMSISSAEMLPVAVVTSDSDLPPTGGHTAKSTVSCQCETSQSLKCRCNDCKTVSAAETLQVSKSTAPQDTATEDRSIGPCQDSQEFMYEKTTSTQNDTDIKQTRELSTQALINQWYQSQMLVDTGTAPIAVENKSTLVLTPVEQNSASVVTSLNKKTQSTNLEKGSETTVQHASVAINTNLGVERRSVGQSLADVFSRKTLHKSMIDTWAQYSHILEQSNEKHSIKSARIGHSKLISSQPLNASSIGSRATRRTYYDNETEPILMPPHNSIAVMTSGPFDEACDTKELAEQVLLCGCARLGCDIETNTLSDVKLIQNTNCSTQIYPNRRSQNLDKSISCADQGDRIINTSTFNQGLYFPERSTADQLSALSHLIGQPISSQMTSDASTILSSNLDAAKWIKRCTNADKEYQSLLDIEQSTLETLKQASLSIASSNKSSRSTKKSLKIVKSKQSVVCSMNTVAVATPPPQMGSVSDDSLADVLPISSVTKKISPPNTLKKTSDKFTSDDVLSKNLKESILQTCPDISDAATDTIVPNTDYLKSASALTSKCVLPVPSICSQSNENSDCVFVYDKPRCAVHKQRIDASVQMSHKQNYGSDDKGPNCREHAIDQMDMDVYPSGSTYEQRHQGNNVVAEVLTPKAEYVFAYDTPRASLEDSTQTCSNCHARLLEIPPYFDSDFVEERMKTQLVGSCRYYSNLLTKRLGRVKEKVTKRLSPPPTEQCLYFSTVPKLSYAEACTMKPSGREDLGCQTIRNHMPSHHRAEFSRPMSCCALSPSLTNICGGTDKNHLKSVYYMLSAIEGRIRRLKRNIPN